MGKRANGKDYVGKGDRKNEMDHSFFIKEEREFRRFL